MTRPISIVPPGILGAVASVLLVCPALAQSWPTRPVTMVVSFAAGSGDDVLGRIFPRHAYREFSANR